MRRSILLLAFLLGACGPARDIGNDCDVSVCGVNDPPDNANVVCQPTSECEALLCVAQGRGLGTGLSAQYCTASCEDERDCPEGFSCLAAVELGASANQKMCLLPAE